MDENKVWIIYKEIDYGNDEVYGDKVYSSWDKANKITEELNWNNKHSNYYVDCMELDKE
jgi:hypothetical protein